MEINCSDTNREIYNAEKLKMFLICMTVTLLLFGVDSVLEFATDTYSTFCESGTWSWMLYGNGRIISAFVYYIIEEVLHMSPSAIYILSYTSAIIFLTLSIYLLSDTVRKYCDGTLCAVLVSVLAISNIFSIEYFLFIEKGLFMFGALLTIVAVRHTINFFAEKKIKEIVIAELMLLCTVYVYQIFLGLYVILLLPFIIYFSNNILQFIKNNAVAALSYGFNMGIGFITTKFLLSSSRVGAGYKYDNIVYALKKICEVFLNSGNVLPRKVFAFAAIVSVLLNILFSRKSRVSLLHVFYIMCGAAIVAFFPYFAGTTRDFALRIMYPFASIIGVLTLNAIISPNTVFKNQHKLSQLLVVGFMLLYITIQSYSFNSIFIDRYKCNQTDKYICSMIVDRINQYQSEHNVEITTICIYEDAQITEAYDGLPTNWRLVPRAFLTRWSDVNVINYYTGKLYQRGEQDEKIREYFLSCDWNTFSDEQLIFDGSVLHLCVY